MKGEILKISRYKAFGYLHDEDGKLRKFDRGELDANDDIKEHDIVRFHLKNNMVKNITLKKRHRKGVVHSFG